MFEGLFQPMHLLVILFVLLLLFGPKKLPEIGKGLGEGIRGFKEAMREGHDKTGGLAPAAPREEVKTLSAQVEKPDTPNPAATAKPEEEVGVKSAK